MTMIPFLRRAAFLALLGTLAACGGSQTDTDAAAPAARTGEDTRFIDNPMEGGSTLADLFNRGTGETKVAVNKYLWTSSLEVLDFLPVQSVDPFTGVILTGYGTPPGGGTAYRATVLIDDPALDARSLNVSLQTRGGRPASAATVRAVEDAILSRARQMRIADNKL